MWQDGTVTYERAGDEGHYDLEFLFDPETCWFDREQWAWTVTRIEQLVEELGLTRHALAHLAVCEEANADPLLVRLVAGENLAQVLRD